jgi:excisionase family DNA binding protein
MDISDRLKVHEQTVRRWLRGGTLRGHNFGGKAGYRIAEAELTRFIASRDVNSVMDDIEESIRAIRSQGGEPTVLVLGERAYGMFREQNGGRDFPGLTLQGFAGRRVLFPGSERGADPEDLSPDVLDLPVQRDGAGMTAQVH